MTDSNATETPVDIQTTTTPPARMRLSASRIKTWMKCPLQAKFQYVDLLPRKQHAAATFGTCVHAALEVYNNGNVADPSRAIAKFSHMWKNPELYGIEPEVWPKYSKSFGGYMEAGIEAIKAYHDQMKWHQRTVLATEHPFLVRFGDFELVGYVDLIEVVKGRGGKEVVRVTDFKAQPLDEPVLTPSGWSRMGALELGDRVIGSDGNPTEVVGIFPQGRVPAFRVTFSDGATVVASGDHYWNVREVGTGKIYTKTTEEISVSLKTGRQRRWFVPTVGAVEFDSTDEELPLDPYLLGVLLGDGGSARSYVGYTKPDLEVKERVEAVLPEGHILKESEGTYRIVAPGMRGNMVVDAMRKLGLLGVKSSDRFIPEVYLRASKEARKSLLAGLCDTDGSTSNRNQFRTSSDLLKRDFIELCRSLGGTPFVSTHAAWYTDKEGVRHEARPSHLISPRLPFNPFRLERKAMGWHERKDTLDRSITSVEPLNENVEMLCIKVAADDGLYVTRDYVVTHNTNAKAPFMTALKGDIQFTIYHWASLQEEFWTGTEGEPDFPGMPNGEWLWEMHGKLPRELVWYGLMQKRPYDAGPRGEGDILRLYRAAKEIEKALKYDVYVPDISGENCGICPYTVPCRLPFDPNEK